MKFRLTYLFVAIFSLSASAQEQVNLPKDSSYEYRISNYVASLRVIDTHEHLFPPEMLKGSYFLDFLLLFQQNGYDDLVSAGMPASLFDSLYNYPLTPVQKWKFIEPYWKNTFNTSFSRIILYGIENLYGISDLNESTVSLLSENISKAYYTDWHDRILRDSCKIDYVIQDGFYMPGKDDYFRYASKFDSWINVKAKYTVDSIAIGQLDPIFTLEDYVKSLEAAFEKEVEKGMVAVKVAVAYSRPLRFENVETETARKIFRTIVNGNEDHKILFQAARPLQDYMFHKLMALAQKHKLPVTIHTGLHAGDGNTIGNSDPTQLSGVFTKYPDVNFVLFHGSYPFGGEASTLAKNFRNVYIDMSWVYSISPSYAERYLNEWLETVPVSKITGFGGDCLVVENVYSELKLAKSIISNVLIKKVRDGYLSEKEAQTVARMILYDNAAKIYNLLPQTAIP